MIKKIQVKTKVPLPISNSSSKAVFKSGRMKNSVLAIVMCTADSKVMAIGWFHIRLSFNLPLYFFTKNKAFYILVLGFSPPSFSRSVVWF